MMTQLPTVEIATAASARRSRRTVRQAARPAQSEYCAGAESAHTTGEQRFLEQLPTIRNTLRVIARKHRLCAEDAEEFAAVAQLRIISNDYAVLRKFRGRSSWRTFLNVVLQRMYLDFRDAQWGRWRNSATGRSGGELAMRFERLTMRDGLSFSEACAVLEINHGLTLRRDLLADMFARFSAPARQRFARTRCADVAVADDADRTIVDAEHNEVITRTTEALQDALALLPERDRRLLHLRFVDALSVAQIARLVDVDQTRLYRRYERLFAVLRAQLEMRGVRTDALLPLLGAPTLSLAGVFDALPA